MRDVLIQRDLGCVSQETSPEVSPTGKIWRIWAQPHSKQIYVSTSSDFPIPCIVFDMLRFTQFCNLISIKYHAKMHSVSTSLTQCTFRLVLRADIFCPCLHQCAYISEVFRDHCSQSGDICYCHVTSLYIPLLLIVMCMCCVQICIVCIQPYLEHNMFNTCFSNLLYVLLGDVGWESSLRWRHSQ